MAKRNVRKKATQKSNIAHHPIGSEPNGEVSSGRPSEPGSKMTSPVAESTYQMIRDPVLLDKIDQLFACNVGEHINLPQLVVVGDQSSGKSSVLEGLTRLPFPRDSGLCTKFATQITFRRAPEKSITVTILPDPNGSNEYKERVRSWNRSDIKKLDSATFKGIMDEVHKVMELSATDSSSGIRKTFSNDVLRLEINGPDETHLSVIDVPGIFRNTTPGVTTAADKELVKDMVVSYMKNPRTVMLTVVPANIDLATQEILEMAKEVDPDCHRTLGVLTKPDLVDEGTEHKIIQMIEGTGPNSKLNWSVVRNPGQKDLQVSSLDRTAIEETFFRHTAPWNALPIERRGVNSLRKRLEKVLTQHIRREFPKVKVEINKKLGKCKRTIKTLGAERDSPEKQKQYLLDLATQFQHVADLAVKADYGANVIFDTSDRLRLATELVNRNEQFSVSMAKYGHQFDFKEDNKSSTEPSNTGKGSSNEETPHAYTRCIANSIELNEILDEKQQVATKPQVDIFEWLKSTYNKSRGFELGTFSSSLLTAAMRQQSSKWKGISCGYTSDAVALLHNFITTLLCLLCGDSRVSERLLSLLHERLLEKYERTLKQAKFLLDVELEAIPMTLNHYFNDNLEKRRQQRLKKEMTDKAVQAHQLGLVVQLDKITQNHSMSNTDHKIRDIHDILCAYYKVARKRFVDNVCMHAAGYHLVHGPDTPLKLFDPSFVIGLTDEQLEEIAGEDASQKRKRAQLKKEIADLEAGRKITM